MMLRTDSRIAMLNRGWLRRVATAASEGVGGRSGIQFSNSSRETDSARHVLTIHPNCHNCDPCPGLGEITDGDGGPMVLLGPKNLLGISPGTAGARRV